MAIFSACSTRHCGVLDQLRQADAADPRREVAEELHQLRPEADRLEQLRPAVALDGRDAHLGDDLLERVLQRREQVLQALVGRSVDHSCLRLGVLEGQPVLDEPQHQVRVDGVGPEGDQDSDVVPFLHVAGLHDQASSGRAGPGWHR